MIWHDWNEFFHMGGYGFYVWGSLIVTVAMIAGELVLVRQRARSALKRARLAAQLGREVGGDEDQA